MGSWTTLTIKNLKSAQKFFKMKPLLPLMVPTLILWAKTTNPEVEACTPTQTTISSELLVQLRPAKSCVEKDDLMAVMKAQIFQEGMCWEEDYKMREKELRL